VDGVIHATRAVIGSMRARRYGRIVNVSSIAAIGAVWSLDHLVGAGEEGFGMSLKRHDDGSPWTLCRRPWTVMYFTANGRALPCCIAPFSQRGYQHYTLGDATQQTLQEIWNGAAYRSFREALLSDKPPAACANCGLRWSL
jgi:radical SAM protein with 4Fe4S-binding SPASM domain